MSTPIIELKGLTKRYGDFTAVDHLDLKIARGEIFGLLGPNGAGKSTTILMMLGLTEPSAGQVSVCGVNAVTNPIEVKRRVGYLPDDVGFYDTYTGLENLMYTAMLNGISEGPARKKAELLLERVGLRQELGKKTGKYSRGMRQRLGLADVLIKDPEVIVLDEPTLGIDPQGVKEFLELIVRLSREEGITVLLSSHHLHQVQQVCDRVGIFVAGRMLAVGDLLSLTRQLFPNEKDSVSARVRFSSGTAGDERAKLLNLLRGMQGVVLAEFREDELFIQSEYDVVPHIARTIVMNGFDLTHLSHKQYGLDEIYQRYFEGGKGK
ncbi:ABC transporter ATP-binding protein [Arcticibacter sp. MXS-1]|uniref:ABC transporter ATP-binding protein n=1 Tax=Arcticibacter sp. MXS-1 TaxID=3341726 RepID=UPI0035A9A575